MLISPGTQQFTNSVRRCDLRRRRDCAKLPRISCWQICRGAEDHPGSAIAFEAIEIRYCLLFFVRRLGQAVPSCQWVNLYLPLWPMRFNSRFDASLVTVISMNPPPPRSASNASHWRTTIKRNCWIMTMDGRGSVASMATRSKTFW